MMEPKHAKELTKQKDWGKKKRKYRNNKGSIYRNMLDKFQQEEEDDDSAPLDEDLNA